MTEPARNDALRHHAEQLGIETSYWDDRGRHHVVNPESLRRVVDVLEADIAGAGPARRVEPIVVGRGGRLLVGAGVAAAELTLADGTELELAVIDEHVTIEEPLPIGCHTLRLAGPGLGETATIVSAPDRMPTSPALAGKAALFVPAYALWEHDAPLPSYGHLAALGRTLPTLGVDVLVTLPLYAAFLDEPFDPSPYAPVSRLHWNEAYLDDAGLPPQPVPLGGAQESRVGDLIDWRALGPRRRRQLLAAAADLDGATALRVKQFVTATPDVADYARFRATVSVDPTDATHPTALVEASHQLAQYLAHQQLSALHQDGAAFALDLPIGSHPLGFETWAHPDLFAAGTGVGAPPDSMFTDGQNWGFPPQLPGAAERSGFELWRRVLSRCGRYASLLRIDHFLGVNRLWWIPDGMEPADGVYVRYPRQTLVAVIAAEAAAAGTTVVAEDLGTVPDVIVETMAQWSIVGLHTEETMLEIERLPEIGPHKVAGLRTHDMAPFALLHERGELAGYRANLAQALGRRVGTSLDDLLDAALGRLADSDAYLVFADLDDLLGETTPHNVPGKVLPTIWRRRLRQPTSATLADPRVRRHLATLTARVGR